MSDPALRQLDNLLRLHAAEVKLHEHRIADLEQTIQRERELSDALAAALKLADCRCWLLAKNKCAKCQALAQYTASRSENKTTD